MDNQFNSLIRSYSDNYIQYKITGSDKYQNAYNAAKQGLDSIINQLNDTVNLEKKQITDFYKSGIEQKITNLEQRNRFLQRGIIDEKDELKAAHMRSQTPSINVSSIQTWQYVTIGILGATAVGLSLL